MSRPSEEQLCLRRVNSVICFKPCREFVDETAFGSPPAITWSPYGRSPLTRAAYGNTSEKSTSRSRFGLATSRLYQRNEILLVPCVSHGLTNPYLESLRARFLSCFLSLNDACVGPTGANRNLLSSPCFVPEGVAKPAFTARIERPLFHRGGSASKKRGLATPSFSF